MNSPEGYTPQSKYLALGDSYTIGEGVQDTERWPVQLVGSLREQAWMVDRPKIVAQTGWTTGELSEAIIRAGLIPSFHLVSLSIGVNNQYRGLSLDSYQVEFRQLLHVAIQLAGNEPGRVLVLSIPDWGVTPFAAGKDRLAIAAEIDAFNELNRIETAIQGAHYINITPLSRRAAGDASMIAHDNLHPSAKMYAGWVRLILPFAIQALSN